MTALGILGSRKSQPPSRCSNPRPLSRARSLSQPASSVFQPRASPPALDALRSATDPQPTDRVVPLSPRQVCRRVQALATRAGLDGVSAHSGRRGMATELVRRGASTTAIQQAGGWKDPQMVARYASAVSVEDGAVARYFG